MIMELMEANSKRKMRKYRGKYDLNTPEGRFFWYMFEEKQRYNRWCYAIDMFLLMIIKPYKARGLWRELKGEWNNG